MTLCEVIMTSLLDLQDSVPSPCGSFLLKGKEKGHKAYSISSGVKAEPVEQLRPPLDVGSVRLHPQYTSGCGTMCQPQAGAECTTFR